MAVNNRYFRPSAAKAITALVSGARMGGSASTKYNRSYTRSYTKTKRKNASKSFSMKKYIRSTLPAKHCPFSDITVTGTHNTLYSFGPSQTIVHGTGNDQRIGDSAHMLSMKINGFVASNAAITKAVEVRIITLWSGEEYACGTSLTAGLTMGEIFLTSATPSWGPNGLINPKAVTVLYDEKFDVNSQIATVADIQSFAHTIPLERHFPYQASGSVMGKSMNLFVYVVGVVSGGSPGVTSVGNLVVATDLIFKD